MKVIALPDVKFSKLIDIYPAADGIFKPQDLIQSKYVKEVGRVDSLRLAVNQMCCRFAAAKG